MASRIPLACLASLLIGASASLVAQETTCEDLKARAAPRHSAKKVWESEPGIAAKELARQVGVPKQETRTWLRRWRATERGEGESDCKLYPSGEAFGGPRDLEAQAEFEGGLTDGERAACGSRVAACRFLIVDCRLPPTLRRLGRRMPSITPRRWVRTTAGECKRKRGQFVVEQPGGAASAGEVQERRAPVRIKLMVLNADGSLTELGTSEQDADQGRTAEAQPPPEAQDQPRKRRVEPSGASKRWERDAELGIGCAQNYLGELHRRERRYDEARRRFEQAAAQGYEKALINLGELYELGLGVGPDPLAALACYEAATGTEMLLDGLAEDLPPEIRTRAINAGKLKGPSIEVVEPWVPFREPQVAVSRDATEQRLFGRVFRTAAIELFELSGEELNLDRDGTFEYDVPLAAGTDEFEHTLVAEDRSGKVDELNFSLVRSAQPLARRTPEQQRSGNYHAFLIGIDDYEDEEFGSLETPVSDTQSLRDELAANWGFESITTLTGREATLETILRKFNGYRRELASSDSLLVYFAGHGQFVKDEFGQEQGYWLPYDAADDRRSWISSAQIAAQVESIRAGRVLIMADSCFSGFLTRSAISSAGTAGRSVSVLTSADETVALDLAPRGSSPFAGALLDVLENSTDVLPVSRLANQVKTQFSNYRKQCKAGSAAEPAGFCAALAKYGQEPVFRPMAGGGHQGGEFTLVPRPR